MPVTALCRDCLTAHDGGPGRCPACRSPRVLAHPELGTLAIAHLDADAFYASIEKRDNPELRDRPVIVGGGARGVVATACYIARLSGVRSAMPMFKALKLCPEAVVVPPRMSLYVEVGRQIRAMMQELTPLVEPLSLDEAFLDLSGTERLHRAPPAVLLARLQARIERELGLTVSVGLSHNKFLAKVASDLDKPRGFRPIGRAETLDFLGAAAGLDRLGRRPGRGARPRGRGHPHHRRPARPRPRPARSAASAASATASGGSPAARTPAPCSPDHALKSISHETTFDEDTADLDTLRWHLWSLAEQVSARAKARELAGAVVTLKLKRADHRVLTRRQTLSTPTQMAERLYRTALPMLRRDMAAAPFRLDRRRARPDSRHVPLGDAEADLLDPRLSRAPGRGAGGRPDSRDSFGQDSIMLGRSLR